MHYEKPIAPQLSGQVKGNFPNHLVPRTDETNIQNIPQYFNVFKGLPVYVSIKHDGSSVTFIKEDDGTFHVCSRNLDLTETPNNSLWRLAHQYELVDALPEGYAVQGECVGPGVQDNVESLVSIDLRVFNVFDIKEQKYLDYDKFCAFCDQLHLKKVDLYFNGIFHWDSIDAMIEEADKAKHKNGARAEGLVWRLQKNAYNKGSLVSVKTKSPKYMIKHGE